MASQQEERYLPQGFVRLRDVLDQKFVPGHMVNVIGSIIDTQALFKTNRGMFALLPVLLLSFAPRLTNNPRLENHMVSHGLVRGR